LRLAGELRCGGWFETLCYFPEWKALDNFTMRKLLKHDGWANQIQACDYASPEERRNQKNYIRHGKI
jgi:hypothetical protein